MAIYTGLAMYAVALACAVEGSWWFLAWIAFGTMLIAASPAPGAKEG